MNKLTLDGREIEYTLMFIDGNERRPEAYRFVTADQTIVVIPRNLSQFHGVPIVFDSFINERGYNKRKTWSCWEDGAFLPSRFDLHFRPHTAEEQKELALTKHYAVTEPSESTADMTGCGPTRDEAKLLNETEHQVEPAPYAIEYIGATYNLRFHGIDFSANDSSGIKYITYFLKHPRIKPNALDLYNQVMGVPPKTQKGESSEEEFKGTGERGGIGYDRKAARDNIKNLLQRSKELNSKMSLDPFEQMELKEIEADIEMQTRKAEGRTLDYKDECTTKKGTIQRAINRALKNLARKQLSGANAKARNDFILHVRLRLMQNFESSFSYEPESDIVWH